MLPNKKIIAFDLDGTLTVSKGEISREMASLMKELIKRSMVVVTSGGKFAQFKNQFLKPFLGDDSMHPFLRNLILLPTSASQRYEYDTTKRDWQLTDKEPMDPSVKERIKKLLKEVIDSGLYDIPPDPAGDIVEDRDTQITFSALGQSASVEAKRAWDPDQQKRKKIVSVLAPLLPEVSLLVNAYSSIDILNKGFNKAVGLVRFLDKIGLQKSDVIFVGDGLFPGGNDYSVYEAGIDTMPVTDPKETESLIQNWIG